MRKCISIVLLLSICLLHAQATAKQKYGDDSFECEIGDINDCEECCETDQLDLLMRPSYGKIEVSWRLLAQSLQYELEEDTAKAFSDEEDAEARPQFNWMGCCIAGGVAVGIVVLIFVASMGRWLASH